LLIIVLAVLAVATFVSQLYIATAVLGIVIAVLLAFLRFNINPAKVFMGDGGAFALAGLISSLVYLLNMRMSIVVPFFVLFLIFILEVSSSVLQLFWKKFFKRKLFPMAPLHHLFEYRGWAEHTIVMKAWLVQGILAGIALLMILFQFS
jgi:phospho-N-acetylmuramoyl-pentapeptide-transferase